MTERELVWDGCLNVRDLGGLALERGGQTRFGVFVRSDNIRRLTQEGWRALESHGVARVVDLRWQEELDDDPPRDVYVDVVHVSLLGVLDPDFTDDVGDFMETNDPAGYWSGAYTRILAAYGKNFAVALAAIADADGLVVFHCAGGKDRTGLIAALLLRLAGVSIDEIARDYSLTFGMRSRGPDEWVEAASEGWERERRMFMQNTPPEAMRLTLELLERKHGSVEHYLRSAGLDDERLERLKERLIP